MNTETATTKSDIATIRPIGLEDNTESGPFRVQESPRDYAKFLVTYQKRSILESNSRKVAEQYAAVCNHGYWQGYREAVEDEKVCRKCQRAIERNGPAGREEIGRLPTLPAGRGRE